MDQWFTSLAAQVSLPVSHLLPLPDVWIFCAVTIYNLTKLCSNYPISNCWPSSLFVTLSYITTFFAFHCFFSVIPRMQRHKHTSCSGTSWQCTGTVRFTCHCHILCCLSSYGLLFTLPCSGNLYIYSAWNVQQIGIELDVIVWLQSHPR